MHPIERLRMVARSDHDEPGLFAQQAAASLIALADEPGALLMACRRLLDRHPTCGPMWWLAARLLAAADPREEAMRAADELDDDPTAASVAGLLPDEAVVAVLGWPEQAGDALHRRLDLQPLVVDCRGEGALLVSRLERAGGRATLVPERGLAAAVAGSDLVLLEAAALGPSGPVGAGDTAPSGFFAPPGSWAAAAVARHAGRPVWVVAGIGRVLPAAFWHAALERTSDAVAWDRRDEVVPLGLVDEVIGPDGPLPPDAALATADAPVVPELTRRGLTPGSEQVEY